MIEECKDYCVIKAFDLTNEEIENCKNIKSVDGVFLKISTENLDSEIILFNKSACEVTFKNYLDQVLAIVSDKVYADYDTTLEECVINNAIKKNVIIAVAESLTGGLLCASLVNVPGSSRVLSEGFVTYTNSAKVRRLHVKYSTIEESGAVSKETAEEMVNGLLLNREITLAVSTTGCAGPASDEKDTPVGKAFIGLGDKDGVKTTEVFFDGNRNTIRKNVVNTALYMMYQYIKEI